MLKKLSASSFAEPFGPLVVDPSVQVPAAVIRSSCPAVTFTPVFTQFLAVTDTETSRAAAGAPGSASARAGTNNAVSSDATSTSVKPGHFFLIVSLPSPGTTVTGDATANNEIACCRHMLKQETVTR